MSIDVTPDVVLATRQPNERGGLVLFSATASIYNGGPGSIYVARCRVSLEQLADSTWNPVWIPICTADPASEIKAGATLDIPVQMAAGLTSLISPTWQSSRVSGQYRIVYAISEQIHEGQMGPLMPKHYRTSEPFTVRDTTEQDMTEL